MLIPLLVVAILMLAAHEAGHVVLTRFLGGRWLGIEFKGIMVGVRLSVKSLSLKQIAWTLAAGPLSETYIVVLACLWRPHDAHWFLLLLGLEWVLNLTPWGLFPNDGTRLWRLWRKHALS
ncbi:M50 family metallopeptidase [Sulfobacillus harzensis]|uniref:Peptidase M50 domain-containing protein n=1 Tax=Sulfobacillus harzensis TaxID=2729629 RepID=A0A7Y0L6X9_9FIRM|nr:M50 family metallopeptidase [Sulfobacillus harzensis]NMP24443.1 hypothetical protein [Sulfobacillus harzensis]